MQHPQRTYPDYRKHAEALAEAIDKQQIAERSGSLWQALLDNARDQYIRRYFEGQIELSQLKALHHNLVAQSCQRAGHERARSSNPPNERAAPNEMFEQAVLPKPSQEGALAEGRDKALIEWRTHDAKAAALALLADCCRTLGMENRACVYEARARLEGATARGLNIVLNAYDRKLEDVGVPKASHEDSPDLQSSFRRLERAERNLKDYNLAHARTMAHLRDGREFETVIQTLEPNSADRSPKSAEHTQFENAVYQRDMVAGLAEKEALAAIRSYRNFQAETQSARREYDALSRSLTGNPMELTKASQGNSDLEKTDRTATPHETRGDLEGSGRMASETKVAETLIKELDPQDPKIQADRSGSNPIAGPNQPLRNVAVSVVVGQMLRELDRGM